MKPPLEPLFPALVLLAVGLIAGPQRAAADDARMPDFDARVGGYAAAELSLSGAPFFRLFFRRGWPTTKVFRGLAIQDAQGAADDNVTAVMTSELGVALADSLYIRDQLRASRFKGAESWGRGQDVVATKLQEFAELAGLEVTPRFKPILFELPLSRPSLTRAARSSTISVGAWSTEGAERSRLRLGAIGMSLWSQAAYARRQLLEAGRKGSGRAILPGTTAEDGFLGLVALQSAIAKLHDLRGRMTVTDGKLTGFSGMSSYGLSGPRRWFPHQVNLKRARGRSVISIDPNKNSICSDLGDQAALLLGACELLELTRFASKGVKATDPRESFVASLFGDSKFSDFRDVPFDPSNFSRGAEVVNFIVTNMQRLHFDADLKIFRSRSSDNPEQESVQYLVSADAGLTLLALSRFTAISKKVMTSFKRESRDPKEVSIVKGLIKSQGYAKTMLRYAARWLRTRAKKQLSDRYDVESRQALAKGASAQTRGMLARGLLAVASLPDELIKEPEREAARLAARDVMEASERDLWNPDYKLYIGRELASPPTAERPLVVATLGQAAMLSALRELAILDSDVRYLIRFKEVLGSLKARGMMASETHRGGEQGEDSDADGVKGSAAVRRAPVLLPELRLVD
jgi:hypothetical protein